MRPRFLRMGAMATAALAAILLIESTTALDLDGNSKGKHLAYSGQLITLTLDSDWTKIGSSNEAVVKTLATEGDTHYLIAAAPGTSYLHALFAPPCLRAVPRCAVLEMIWSVEMEVA